jgi:hypothetical protein
MGSTKRIRDLAIETLIAIILVSAYVAYLFWRPKESGLDWQLISQAVNTAIVFGFVIAWFRHAWKSFLFWAVLAIFLLGHLAAYKLLAGHAQHWPLAYYAVLNAIELILFSQLFNKLLSKGTAEIKSQ